MLNYIWLGLILGGVLLGAFQGRVKELIGSTIQSAQGAVTIAFGLIGIMALWLGLMRLAERAGLIQRVASFLRPVLCWLFPEVPPNHPAMGSIVMNIAANMLGLNNAATPLGLRAMKDLESINPRPGVATNAMCTFLALNTSSVQLIPITAVGLLASGGSKNPAAIIGTALCATLCAATAAIIAVKALAHLRVFQVDAMTPSMAEAGAALSAAASPGGSPEGLEVPPTPPAKPFSGVVLVAFGLCFLWLLVGLSFPGALGLSLPLDDTTFSTSPLVRVVNAISILAVPFLVSFFPLYAALHGIPVYEQFVEGAKEGFQVFVRIVPFLVAMLTAIGVFRAAGGVDLVTRALRPVLDLVRFPAELVPLALMRTLSGSASFGLLTDLVHTHGPDSLLARTAGTLYGSTETTFYVVAVYFGSVNVMRTRHAVPAGLIADATGAIASVIICRFVFSGAL